MSNVIDVHDTFFMKHKLLKLTDNYIFLFKNIISYFLLFEVTINVTSK